MGYTNSLIKDSILALYADTNLQDHIESVTGTQAVTGSAGDAVSTYVKKYDTFTVNTNVAVTYTGTNPLIIIANHIVINGSLSVSGAAGGNATAGYNSTSGTRGGAGGGGGGAMLLIALKSFTFGTYGDLYSKGGRGGNAGGSGQLDFYGAPLYSGSYPGNVFRAPGLGYGGSGGPGASSGGDGGDGGPFSSSNSEWGGNGTGLGATSGGKPHTGVPPGAGGAGHRYAGQNGYAAYAGSSYIMGGGPVYGDSNITALIGGSGAGGGANDNDNEEGAGGGASGGVIFILAARIIGYDASKVHVDGGEGGLDDYQNSSLVPYPNPGYDTSTNNGGHGSDGWSRIIDYTASNPSDLLSQTKSYFYYYSIYIPLNPVDFSFLYKELLNEGVDPGSYSNIKLTDFRRVELVPNTAGTAISVLDHLRGAYHYVARVHVDFPLSYEFGLFNVTGTVEIDGSGTTFDGEDIIGSGHPFANMVSVTSSYFQYHMGSVYKFHNAGNIYAIGSQSRWGGKISLFQDGVSTAKATVDVVGAGSSTTLRIDMKYTSLSSPWPVAANSTYRIIFKGLQNGSGGGYSYFNYSYGYSNPWQGTNNTNITGNISWMGASHKYEGIGATQPYPIITTNGPHSTGYGTTDIIFAPS